MRVIKAVFLAGLIATTSIASQTNAHTPCPDQAPDAVIGAVQDMYAALAASDASTLELRLAPTFYAFEGGVRFGRKKLTDLIATRIANGAIYRWSVTEPDVQMSCGLASVAYVNVGGVGDASGMKAVTWLESATLRFEDGRWKILFLNSTRAPSNPG